MGTNSFEGHGASYKCLATVGGPSTLVNGTVASWSQESGSNGTAVQIKHFQL